MESFEIVLRLGWKPIPYLRIDDVHRLDSEKQAKGLARVFERYGLDITKRYRKSYENKRRTWLFLEDAKGELITLEPLIIPTTISSQPA